MSLTASLQFPIRGSVQTNEWNDYKACSCAMQLTFAEPGAIFTSWLAYIGIVFTAQKTGRGALAKIPSRKQKPSLVLERGRWCRLKRGWGWGGSEEFSYQHRASWWLCWIIFKGARRFDAKWNSSCRQSVKWDFVILVRDRLKNDVLVLISHPKWSVMSYILRMENIGTWTSFSVKSHFVFIVFHFDEKNSLDNTPSFIQFKKTLRASLLAQC